MSLQKSLFILIILSSLSCTKKDSGKRTSVSRIAYTVQSSLPHDTKAFTEGLLIHNGQLYESTGQDGSWIGIVNPKTGSTDKKIVLPNEYFGEGITILNNKIYQLTYKSHKGFVYDLHSFKKLREFSYNTPGWGLTHDTRNLIMSDGSDQLYFLDTTTLKVTRTLHVTDESGPLSDLNELEYIDGFIYANVWFTDRIVKIDPETGSVKGIIDLTVLCNDVRTRYSDAKELNGIAWYPATKKLLVTGKYWPLIYALQLKQN